MGSAAAASPPSASDARGGRGVHTGPWIFGRKVLLPAGTIAHVNHANRKVHADRTKDQIKDSPEYDESTFRTPDYRSRVGTYYEDSYRAWPPM